MPLFLPHFNLQNYNTLASPVVADFFVCVKAQDELLDAIKFARERKLPLLVLGGGSNVVLYANFPGLVIHVQLRGKEIVRENGSAVYVTAAAGENWSDFVEYCLDEHLWGLENLSLIPGSVGAAPIQNIGAYGVELKDLFSELTAIEIKSGLAVTFTREACRFGYRDSVFKNELLDQFIITSVTFRLSKIPDLKIQYPALADALVGDAVANISPAMVSRVVSDIRRSKLPDPAEIPNVGSFFKNPVISKKQLEAIQQSYPDLVSYPVDTDQVKIAAGWLIDRAGWRGYEGDACVHKQQALVLTNPHRGTADRVLVLADQIRQSVLEKFGVALEQEPRNYP